MAKDGPDWKGLLKWSIANTDGSRPNRDVSEEDRRWFMEAMQSQSIDVIKRMKEIILVMQTPDHVLEAQGVTIEDMDDMMEELEGYVESIDMANDFHSIGGLVPLLDYLKNSNAIIRAKAAGIVTTIVQNNPKGQQVVMEANGFQYLLSNFISDPDIIVRTKSLGAISSLIRDNEPAIAAFRLANGYAGLRDALSSENVKFQRRALMLIQNLIYDSIPDCNIVIDMGFPRSMIHLVAHDDSTIREASLQALLELLQQKPDGLGPVGLGLASQLKRVLEEHVKVIGAMSGDDLRAAKEEIEIIDRLWSCLYEESSGLREKGVLDASKEDEREKVKSTPLLLGA